jgi:lipoprotein-releasing system ATP-binding protein
MFAGFVKDAGLAALVATHNMELARRMDRTIRLEDGHLTPSAGLTSGPVS